jgi:hypothetical protein
MIYLALISLISMWHHSVTSCHIRWCSQPELQSYRRTIQCSFYAMHQLPWVTTKLKWPVSLHFVWSLVKQCMQKIHTKLHSWECYVRVSLIIQWVWWCTDCTKNNQWQERYNFFLLMWESLLRSIPSAYCATVCWKSHYSKHQFLKTFIFSHVLHIMSITS